MQKKNLKRPLKSINRSCSEGNCCKERNCLRLGVDEMPRKYILPRWTQNALPGVEPSAAAGPDAMPPESVEQKKIRKQKKQIIIIKRTKKVTRFCYHGSSFVCYRSGGRLRACDSVVGDLVRSPSR